MRMTEEQRKIFDNAIVVAEIFDTCKDSLHPQYDDGKISIQYAPARLDMEEPHPPARIIVSLLRKGCSPIWVFHAQVLEGVVSGGFQRTEKYHFGMWVVYLDQVAQKAQAVRESEFKSINDSDIFAEIPN